MMAKSMGRARGPPAPEANMCFDGPPAPIMMAQAMESAPMVMPQANVSVRVFSKLLTILMGYNLIISQANSQYEG